MSTLSLYLEKDDKEFGDFTIAYRIHSTKNMFRRNIKQEEVEYILRFGEIIEEYKDDFPFPSVLINGKTTENKQLHVVAGINKDESIIVVITTYIPDPSKWSENYSRRLI